MPAIDNFRWNQRTLNIVFASSSVILLLAVYCMMKQDQADEWRDVQRRNFAIEAEIRAADLKAIETPEFKKQKAEMQEQVIQAQQALDEAMAAKKELFDRQAAEQLEVDRLEIDLKFKNSERDEARANYDLAVRDALPQDASSKRFEEAQARQKICDETQLKLDEARTKLEATLAEVKSVTAQHDQAVSALEKLEFEANRVEASLEKIRPTNSLSKWKRSLMELPIIDGFNSHLRIVQDWIPQLRQTLGMAKIARFDRCRTCHLNIDKTTATGGPAFPAGHPEVGADLAQWVKKKQYPQPYSTHPNTELFCTASSPHPVAKFGCTICHDGQGSGTSFGNAEHTPNHPNEAEDWHHERGYHPNHFWEYPMQPSRFAESTCIKCHHSVTELAVNPKFGNSAPKVTKGFQLIQKYGCFGCHEIQGYDGGLAIGPDMRLEPQTDEERARVAADPTQKSGDYRKVGPSLRHIATKADSNWIQFWTKVPSAFRPSTKMPQFFALHDHLGEDDKKHTASLESVELAGLATVLLGSSQPIDLLSPVEGYQANAERGKQLFGERGCLACHQHKEVPGGTSDFGPNISDIHLKVNRDSDNPEFSKWLYTWIREPERYHKRTKMPQLYLDAYLDTDGKTQIDPAADITAFLLSFGGKEDYSSKVQAPTDADIDTLVELYLKKSRFTQAKAQEIIKSGKFDQKLADVVGDEQALATEDGAAVADPSVWKQKKLEYVGRKTVARYGCYACHDMPGYETARPIGVALHDWGRKDTSKLGFEHVAEFLHHHGEPSGASTAKRVEVAAEKMAAGGAAKGEFTPEQEASEMAASFFFDSLTHHGRPGFIWQKLRGPRSYDYEKTETKGYDERLRMPKFPFKEDEIEAIATFVLGLVAEPPAEAYVYKPDERAKNRVQGEFLLAKYNCTGCHMVELPKVTFAADPESILATEMTPGDHPKALEMLLKVRPPEKGYTGEMRQFVIEEEKKKFPVASFHGLLSSRPDPEEEDPEFREYGFDVWHTVVFGEGDNAKRLLPGSKVTFPESRLIDLQPGRGGSFAEWLVETLMQTKTDGKRELAWQASPPPLYQEGIKVQTPWLYQFLLEPSKIRYTTVLRMPRFNMSESEARTLANYFAAVDGAPFPYQEGTTTDPDYLSDMQMEMVHGGLLTADQSYLSESWKTLNGPLCVKCHSLAGKKFKVSDPAKDIQGPNLNNVQNRLRADWVKLWLYNPKWITPYTSMPLNFPKNNTSQFPDLFKGEPDAHVIGTRDALMNYNRLMEDLGPTNYAPPSAAPAAVGGAAEE